MNRFAPSNGRQTVEQIILQLADRTANITTLSSIRAQIDQRLSDYLDVHLPHAAGGARHRTSRQLRHARETSERRLFPGQQARRFEDRIRYEYHDTRAVTIKAGIVVETRHGRAASDAL